MVKIQCIILIYLYFCTTRSNSNSYEMPSTEYPFMKKMSLQQLKEYYKYREYQYARSGSLRGFKIAFDRTYQTAYDSIKPHTVASDFYCALKHLVTVQHLVKKFIIEEELQGHQHLKDYKWTDSPITRIFTPLYKNKTLSAKEKIWLQRNISIVESDAREWNLYLNIYAQEEEPGIAGPIAQHLNFDEKLMRIFCDTIPASSQIFRILENGTLKRNDGLADYLLPPNKIPSTFQLITSTDYNSTKFKNMLLLEYNYRLRQEDINMLLLLRRIYLEDSANILAPSHKLYDVKTVQIGVDDENKPIVIPLYFNFACISE